MASLPDKFDIRAGDPCFYAVSKDPHGPTFSAESSYQAYYDLLVHQGRQRHPDPPASGRRGRVKRDLAQNLLLRLETRRPEILAFLEDLTIPFDNNAAERALRMMKE